VTYFFVPDMTGVDLAEEDARFMEYLERSGWKGEVGLMRRNIRFKEGGLLKPVSETQSSSL
jgi:hypothetical protein